MNLKPIFSKLGKMIVCSLLVFTLFVSNAAPSQAAQLTINKIEAETVSLGFPSPSGWLGSIAAIAGKVGGVGKGTPGPIGTVSSVIQYFPDAVKFATDLSQNSPDELYLKKDGGKRFWPPVSKYTNLYPGRSKALSPNLKVDFGSSVKIGFWEYDTVSSDDDLGTLTVTASEAGQGVKSAVVSNPSEGNLYYVEYEVR